MRDNFKKYAEDHIEGFDHSFDVEAGWSDFQKRNPEKKNKWQLMMIAASVTLLISVGVVFFLNQKQQPQELSEWQEVQLFYQTQIQDMTTLVTNMTDDDQILYDLEEMDQAFAELKADLKDDAANEEVIEAMMNHYRLKLRILEQMLEEIRDENESEKDISLL